MTPADQVRLPLARALEHLARAAEMIGRIADATPEPVADGPALTGDIVRAICWQMGLRPAQVCGGSRLAPLVRARDAIFWVAHRATGHSLARIGLVVGGRDHATVAAAIARAERRRAADPAFRMVTDRVAAQFRQEQDDGCDRAQIA